MSYRHHRCLTLTTLILLITSLILYGQQPPELNPRLILSDIPAPSLSSNLLGERDHRQIAVYLPPSYYASQVSYPVVYFLTGFGDEVTAMTDGTRGLTLPSSLDSVVTEDSLREMILVIVSGTNSLGGSFYVNSPVSGNWEDFIARDLVTYVDRHYRTIADGASRGLSGHSMGGSGALTIAMRNPGVFGAVYLMSPPVADTCGLAKTEMFAAAGVTDSVLQILESLKPLKKEAARKQLTVLLANSMPAVSLSISYGAAFASDTDLQFPHVAYPYHRENGLLVADSLLLRKWECGFGALPMKLWRYRDNLVKLRRIGLECGLNDESPWIREGCGYLSIQLDLEEIPHTTSFFRGGHRDKLAQRIREAMLPFFSEALSFQS